MRLRMLKCSLFLIVLLAARAAYGLMPDPRLLQLVPPHSHLVAGMSRTAAQGISGSFLVLTRENKTDLKDFFALTGGDASRRLSAMVFVAGESRGSDEYEHSLLVSGQFNREAIFRFGAAGATRESYQGVPVLVVPPFERERDTFNETRLLAVLDNQIAVFGSVESVRREIDRWVEHSTPDPLVLDELHRFEGNDDSWCLLLAWDRQRIAESALGKLDAKLSSVADDPGILSWGIKFSRKIQIVVNTDAFPAVGSDEKVRAEQMEKAAAMGMFSYQPNNAASNRLTVRVSRRRYEEWLTQSAPADPLLPGPMPGR